MPCKQFLFLLSLLTLYSLKTYTIEHNSVIVLPIELIIELACNSSSIIKASAFLRTCKACYQGQSLDTILYNNKAASNNLSSHQHIAALVRYAQQNNLLYFEAIIKNETKINTLFRKKILNYFGYKNTDHINRQTLAYLGIKNGKGRIEDNACSESIRLNNPQALLVFLKNNIKSENNTAMTPLMLACKQGKYYMAQDLINHGHNINSRNYIGLTALHYATEHPRIVKLLLKQANCSTLNAQDLVFLNTPLHRAIRNNHLKTAKLLINYGADINLKNKNSQTAVKKICVTADQTNPLKRKSFLIVKEPESKKRKL